MPQKRKQCEEDSSEPVTCTLSKRCKSTSTAAGLQASYSSESGNVNPSVVNQLDQVTHSELKAVVSESWAQQSTTMSATQKLSGSHSAQPGSRSAQSRLVPRGERRTAKIGQKDATLLRILCDDTESGDVKELHFRNMPHSSIDWSDSGHVHKINNWRNQIYGRAGFKSKAVTIWLPDEELWFELYYHIMIAESRARGILLPKNARVLEAFNKTFVGRIVQDHNDRESAPRTARQFNAFASKFNRMCPKLRARLKQCIFGKSGDIFVPDITLGMVSAYKDMKAALEESGIVEESDYAEHLSEWCHLFAHLPGTSHVTKQQKQLSMAEDDAAAVLISLSQDSVQSEGEDDVLKTSEVGADHKEFEDPSTPSIQYSNAPWNEHGMSWSPTKNLSVSSSTTPSHLFDDPVRFHHDRFFTTTNLDSQSGAKRSVTPVCELDIDSLIASPD
ncbi:hypothetical protein DE146DRAFT_789439 [Phaeosphaeria sp. MPI-PUGE-AT-0046c]|nr:hypothetical protein DE146DRAFT_789439 [Phaeosphaeria sp. MPI-PUGE-AT-0046c]